MSAHVLMLSSSRKGSENYLEHALTYLYAHLGEARKLLFVPFAGVSVSWDDYTAKVAEALPDFEVTGLHQQADPLAAIQQAQANGQAIVVGGGNTFNLLHNLHAQQLTEPLKQAIASGTPYIGWSAGSNICGRTICTTNDMPVIQPASFDALAVLPCQLNPHYNNYTPPGHNGETRDERLNEFCILNPHTPILAIPEGSALSYCHGELKYLGDDEGYVFVGQTKQAIQPTAVLNQYLG